MRIVISKDREFSKLISQKMSQPTKMLLNQDENYKTTRSFLVSFSFSVCIGLLTMSFSKSIDSSLKITTVSIACFSLIISSFSTLLKCKGKKSWMCMRMVSKSFQTIVVCWVIVICWEKLVLLQMIFVYQLVILEDPTPFCNLLRISTAVSAVVSSKNETSVIVCIFVAIIDAIIDIVKLSVTLKQPQNEPDQSKVHPLKQKTPIYITSGGPVFFQKNSVFGKVNSLKFSSANQLEIVNSESPRDQEDPQQSVNHNYFVPVNHEGGPKSRIIFTQDEKKLFRSIFEENERRKRNPLQKLSRRLSSHFGSKKEILISQKNIEK